MTGWQTHKGLTAPVNVTWEITNRCNLSCIHCLSDSGPEREEELSLAQCMKVIDQLSRQQVFQVNFGGGEPFARKDFPQILEACHQRGLVTCISTNATLLKNHVLDLLIDREGVYIQISLDGASPSTNDRIRGQGTFHRISDTLERLHIRKIPFSLNMVLTRLNISEIDAMRRLAGDYGARLRVSRFRPSGRGRVAWNDLSPGKEELYHFSRWLNAHRDVATGDSFFSLQGVERRDLGLNLCGAAKFTCCIDPVGRVYPCAFLQDAFFYGGSLLEEALGEIWSQARGFSLLRKLKISSCESCFRYDSCHGGCPAVAYYKENALELPDPECLIHCINAMRRAL